MIPPHDADAEQNLAGMALDTRTWVGPLPRIEDDFYIPRWRTLYVLGLEARARGEHVGPRDIPAEHLDAAHRAVTTWLPYVERYAVAVTYTAAERRRLREAADLLGAT